MASSQLKKDLHELCQIVRPYRIAYELAEARRGRDSTSDRLSNSDGAGDNPHPSTPIVESHQDHQSGSSPRGAGTPKAPKEAEP